MLTEPSIVYRPKLIRRLMTLQKKVKADVAVECSSGLAKASEVRIEGTRIHVIVDEAGKFVSSGLKIKKEGKGLKIDSKQSTLPFKQPESAASSSNTKIPAATGKSIWRGRDDDEVTVEILALQHYENAGYKGWIHPFFSLSYPNS